MDETGLGDMMRAIKLDADSIAIYDLTLPGRNEWRSAEKPALKSRGFVVLDLPDGAVLEEAWEAAPEWRIQLEVVRTKLASAVDGEVFFRAARRAVWLARECSPKKLYGPGIAESLAVWLAAKLIEPTPMLALAFDAQQYWQTALLIRLGEDADRLSDGTGRLGQDDALQHGPILPKRHRIGPLKWKTRGVAPTADERAQRILAWL